MKTQLIKQFQDEVAKIDTHYINACQDAECERTLVGVIFEKYLMELLESLKMEERVNSKEQMEAEDWQSEMIRDEGFNQAVQEINNKIKEIIGR